MKNYKSRFQETSVDDATQSLPGFWIFGCQARTTLFAVGYQSGQRPPRPQSYRFKGKDQKPETHTNWHRLTFYNELADLAISFEQGDNLFAEGSLQQRQFTPADGSKRTVSEIVVKSCHLISPSRNGHSEAESTPGQGNPEKSKTDEVFDQNWPL